MSDNRPCTTTNIISETSTEEYDPNILGHDIQQDTLHFRSDDKMEQFQNQEPQQIHTIQKSQQDTIRYKSYHILLKLLQFKMHTKSLIYL